jgi:putative restriction endonuclease
MELIKPQELFSLSAGDTVSKRNLFDLIQYSKVESSTFWGGDDYMIGNTPQQGINWVGQLPAVKAVIIKTRPGSYEEDGWSDESKATYHYSFKARNSVVSFEEKANKVLIGQPQHLYPILLFTECAEGWEFEGVFSVVEIEDKYVVLDRGVIPSEEVLSAQDEQQFKEGGLRYVTHLMAERSRNVVKAAKQSKSWVCEICGIDFQHRYGVSYIEAHHKVPISTYSSRYIVKPEDLALLCPNCHKAVHIYMKDSDMEYQEIKRVLSSNG